MGAAAAQAGPRRGRRTPHDASGGWMTARRLLAAAAALALLAGCSSDDGDDDGGVSAEGAPGTEAAADTSTTESEGSAEGCPSTTTLTAVTETTYEGDVEVIPPGTEFPAAHVTVDLDGSGFGPVLSGVLSTDASEDVASMTHASTDQPTGDVVRVELLLTGPAEGETEFPLGVYDVTFEDGKVSATEGMGLDELDVVDAESAKQAANFTELELTYVGDDKICGELRPVDRSDETSQAATWVEGSFVAEYSEQP